MMNGTERDTDGFRPGDGETDQGGGLDRSIRPRLPVPTTVLVADMGNGALLLCGWRGGPNAYLCSADSVRAPAWGAGRTRCRGERAPRCTGFWRVTRWIAGVDAGHVGVLVRCSGGNGAAARSGSRRATGYISPTSSCCCASWPANWNRASRASRLHRPRPSRLRSPGGDPHQAGRPDPDHGGAGKRPERPRPRRGPSLDMTNR